MKPYSVRSFSTVIIGTLVVLGLVSILSFALMPRLASAAAVTLTSVTSTSTPAYTNTGFATTTRATTADTVQYQLTLSGTPLIAPQINIFSMGSTTMSGAATAWYYATTTTALWTESPVTFSISVGGTTGAEATTTVTHASLTGTNVTYDKTGPTLNSVSWSDADSSTQFSATDTLTLTFNETMATSTITTGNVDTTLALSGSHTFGTSPTVSWNTAGTVLTLTLGTAPTLATADTVDPTTAVKDAIGNADATGAALTITDNVSPGTPTGLTNTNFGTSISVGLSSTGSSQIRYTTDSTTPTCSAGTVYSSAIAITETTTLKVVGCDEASNASSVVTAIYTLSPPGGGGGGGGGSSNTDTPAVPATQIEGCATGNAFNTLTGKSCTVPATPAVPASGCGPGYRFSITTGKSCTIPAVPATPATTEFKSNLTIGTFGAEVKALQLFLNAHGYTVATAGPGSSGNETTTFGALTRAALAKYQAAKGIVPAVGYFGPITRAAINAEQ